MVLNREANMLVLNQRAKNTLVLSKPGGGHSINYWVGMCRWDSETLSLY